MTTPQLIGTRFKAGERGITLVITLVFMVALTLLGVGLIKATTAEERMGRNYRDYDRAFAAAEAALRDAEIRISGVYAQGTQPLVYPTNWPATNTNINTCSVGLCAFSGGSPNLPQPPIYANSSYTLDGTPAAPLGTTTNSPAIAGVTQQPNYYIEALTIPTYGGGACQQSAFRITSKGYGIFSTTTVLLQEVVLGSCN
jgi:type IV pilus assembly protein PilX